MPISIEVKNLKYAAFASEETHCYSATIYVDGKRFCIGRNDGHGGCDMYDPIDHKKPGSNKTLWDEISKLNERIKIDRAGDFETKKRADGSEFTIGPDFEWLVSDAVADALYVRDYKAALRKQWLFTKKGDGGLYYYAKDKRDPDGKMCEIIMERNPGAVILNNLPEADGFKVWKAHG